MDTYIIPKDYDQGRAEMEARVLGVCSITRGIPPRLRRDYSESDLPLIHRDNSVQSPGDEEKKIIKSIIAKHKRGDLKLQDHLELMMAIARLQVGDS